MKKILTMLMSVAFASAAYSFARAETIAVTGGEITYEGASEAKTLPNGDVILVFTNVDSEGSFSIPANMSAKARILAVGGGGAGGSTPREDTLGRGAAGGGGAGGVSDREIVLSNGVYTVEVGEGGKRVQTIVQSWTGDNGGNTNLKIGGMPVASAKGGGGGGSVKVNGRGEFGGSGGGGSWFGHSATESVFYKGGDYVDGQGWGGGTPHDDRVGGGGGGAAKAAADGMGGADGTAGAGRVLDITGEAVEYSRGGRGGTRIDESYVPADGAGFGWGGDGAVCGYAGTGANGCFIIRIHKLFSYNVVSIPEYVKSFEFVPNQTITAFDLASADESLRSAISYVEGVTSTNCTIQQIDATHTVTNGLGRFFFALHLNDESVWEGGSTAPLICYWRVKDPGIIGESEIDITKTVEWFDGTNATIAIDVCAKPEMVECTPRVLILGSLCGKHGLTDDIVRATINSAAQIADVDFYYFNRVDGTSNPDGNDLMSGSIKKGEGDFNGRITANDGSGHTTLATVSRNHGTMYGYYNKLWEIIEAGKEYDYIVFSFDRSRIATAFPGKHPHEAEVVQYLKGFYNRNAVIWLVDEEPVDWSVNGQVVMQQTPWIPNQLVSMRGKNDEHFFGTLQYYVGSVEGPDNTFVAMNAMLGMFSPEKYPLKESDYEVAECESGRWSNSTDHHVVYNTAENIRKIEKSAGYAIENQCAYDDAHKVSDFLQNVVKSLSSTVRLRDNIHYESGLRVVGATAYWTTNESVVADWSLDPAVIATWTAQANARPGTVWTKMDGASLHIEEDEHGRQTGVAVDLENIWDTAWVKLRMEVVDAGGFRSSVGATFNEQTGLWEKDPNNGPVIASMTPDGSETVLAEASATTAVAWSFPTFKLTGEVVHGKGQVILNGFVTDSINVAEGCTPEVVFRGAGGYVLDYLEVDGRVIDDFDNDLYNWYFENVESDHNIKVGFKSVFTVPYPTTSPLEIEYDGASHGPANTEPTFIEGYSYEWYPVYSLDPDGVFTRDGGLADVQYDQYGNVVARDVYVRICIMQPGWEDGVMIDQWTGVNTVKILPRQITVKMDDVAMFSNNRTTITSSVVDGSLVPGDTLVVTGKVNQTVSNPGRNEVLNGTPIGTVVVNSDSNGDMLHIYDADGVETTANYSVTKQSGYLYYYGIAAHAINVTKTYDGNQADYEVVVSYPQQERFYEITYSTNGGQSYSTQKPTFTDAGVYTINYKVSGKGNQNAATIGGQRVRYNQLPPYENSLVVTILPRPVTVQAGSAEKAYDGTALTQPSYTIESGTNTGFVGGDGITSLSMTAESTQTLAGSTANVVDPSSVRFANGTKTSNYAIEYVDGHLTVTGNPIKSEAHTITKVYDGKPVDASEFAIAVSFTNGTPFTAGYTIRYAADEFSELSTTMPTMPTDAGDYSYYYEVDAGGYGKSSGYVEIKVTPRDVRLAAGSAEKEFDGVPLATNSFSVVSGSSENEGFVGDDMVASVVMTPSSVVEGVGTAANVIDTSDIAATWTFAGGMKPQNYNFIVEPGTLVVRSPIAPVIPADPAKVHEPGYTGNMNSPASPDYPGYAVANDESKPWVVAPDPLVAPVEDPERPGTFVTNYVAKVSGVEGESKLTFTVTGDGEFRWESLIGGEPGESARFVVLVDGVTSQVYSAETGWTGHVVHVTDLPGNDGGEHVIEVVYVDGGATGGTSFAAVDKVAWTASATLDEIYGAVVNTKPPTYPVEEIKKAISVSNDVESGWLPVYETNGDGSKTITALRTPDGTEGGDAKLHSELTLGVNGSGEISFGSITVPVKGDSSVNPDGGALTIIVDGVVYEIPPVQNENVSYSIVTNGDVVVISNLIIKVWMDDSTGPVPHTIVLAYDRDADSIGTNTWASVEDVTWKTYGETDDGGTSWLDLNEDEGRALMIVDHEPLTNGWVYLAFNPQLKYAAEEIEPWARRTAASGKLKVKFGSTREDCDACEPISAALSDENDPTMPHEIATNKVWVMVRLTDIAAVCEDITNEYPVGFWRIYISGNAIAYKTAGASGVEEETLSGTPGAVSVNVFGIFKVESAFTNTMIAVPWTWYSAYEKDASAIPVSKLVKTTNLTDGDVLYAYDGNGAYAAWMLFGNEWMSGPTVPVDENGNAGLPINWDEAGKPTLIERGYGLWLHRQRPVDDEGKPVPFWLYGQSVTNEVTSVVRGGSSLAPSWAIIGNPYCKEIRLNDIEWTGGVIGPEDRLVVPNGSDGIDYLIYDHSSGKGWYRVEMQKVGKWLKNTYNYDVTIPAGRAFWYRRHTDGDLTVRWRNKD